MNNYILYFIGDVFFILFLGGVKMILEVFSNNINVVLFQNSFLVARTIVVCIVMDYSNSFLSGSFKIIKRCNLNIISIQIII